MKKSKLNLNLLVLVVFMISSFYFSSSFVLGNDSKDNAEIQELKKKMQLLEYDQKYEQRYKKLEKETEDFFATEKIELEKLKNEVNSSSRALESNWNLLDNQIRSSQHWGLLDS